MSDCLKCWDTPCNCGYDYRDYNVEYFSKFIVDILSYKTPEERMQILQKALQNEKLKLPEPKEK
jgi:hypothetical protein